ncbi:MAG: TlyA family RNA methyltransferase [Verrucomicrobiaceae bacterium]|nr:TlyA family RNA methyltransferase [Verrucomicrobiaceae bacterium]
MVKSREEAKRLILAGEVLVGGHVIDKPASKVSGETVIYIKERPKYVSRGGLKLEAALNDFGINAVGRVAIDIGSSTGGFTDCLLQRGASQVYAFDVGTNQLAWKIRNDKRVVVREKFNCRKITPSDVDEPPTIAVADVSFISLTKILEPLVSVIASGFDMVVIVKPQLEFQRDEVGRGGVIKDR